MLDINLAGAEELSARLSALPDHLRAALSIKIDALAQALYSQIVDVNLGGALVQTRSGALRESIRVETRTQNGLFEVDIYADGGVPYAGILEFGGKTAAHEILPDKAKALAFPLGGKMHFARRIQHPGSTFAARSFLGSALDGARGDIATALTEIVASAAKRMEEQR
jgi:hypothetical protein